MAKNSRLSSISKGDQDRAAALFNAGKMQEAEVLYRGMLTRDKNDNYATYHLALIHCTQKEFAEGLRLVDRAKIHAPGFAPLWYVNGMLLYGSGDSEQALQRYDRAIKLAPQYADALLNSGVLLRELFQHHKALERFEQLLRFHPEHLIALGNCATLLAQVGQPQRSIAMFDRLVRLDPHHPYAPGMLCYERLRSCDWTDLEPLSKAIIEGVRAERRVCKSFALMALQSSARDQFLCARVFANERYPRPAHSLWNGERYAHDRLRIGYVSPDFREHPVSHLMSGIFERHDRSRFEIIAISIGMDDGSRFRKRLEGSFDQFIDLAGQGSLQIAQRIRALEVDILIDLAGYTSDARPEVFAHRPAPIQVNYLGYPGSMASDHYDYIVADRHVIPPEHQAFYSERVAYLPDSYLPTDTGLKISERTPTRAECGLPEVGPVLCAFSHNFKINPPLFDAWMRILQQLPGSVLWLASRAGPMQDNLRREAQERGIDPARLVFAGRVPQVEDHLARYRLADLFLDTSPYNAHTTAADALMAGLPVVTCQGDAFPARVAASLLHAIGLPELITSRMADYEALVVQLVQDPARLQAIKDRLAANRHTHALFDSDRFCRNLEAALTLMHTKQVRAFAAPGLTPVAATEKGVAGLPRRLHIGGKLRCEGWEVLNALPGPNVDHLGNANDLSRFADNSFEVVYASHVVEHFDYRDELHRTLAEWLRVLQPGGSVEISVPDLEILAGLMLNKQLPMLDHFKVMMMIFGGHVDAFDYHKVGLTEELLGGFLLSAGFTDVRRVERFPHFHDTSDMSFAGQRISLNMSARKPHATALP